METLLRVLSEEEKNQVHERTLNLLWNVGVRVDSAQARQILLDAGAELEPGTEIVYFPREMVEESLRVAPKEFTLSARRPDWDLPMNMGDCTLVADGEGTSILDRKTGEHRATNFADWLEVTRLIDALDEIGVFWSMTDSGAGDQSIPRMAYYWGLIFQNFSKHVQDMIPTAAHAPWFLEILQTVFGDRETIRQTHPVSLLLCPQSPLIIDQQHTDAYLALRGWDIPVAIMPMPLMGGTAPGNKISSVVLGNCEVLATICLLQTAAPGTPVLYAPVLATMNPRTGFYSGGAIENAILNSAAIEMGRYYGLPVEGTGGGTDQFISGVQAGYERALTAMMPVLSWPDLMVSPGLLGSSMILSMDQLLIDIEIFRMNRQAHRGISTEADKWLDEVIERVGPAGNFLGERSTRDGIRNGSWLINRLGIHEPIKAWEDAGKPTVEDQVKAEIEEILNTHKPLPLDQAIVRELEQITERAKNAVGV